MRHPTCRRLSRALVASGRRANRAEIALTVLALWSPTTAVVKVTMEKDAAGADYTDYHSLIKIDGQWKVVARLLHVYDQ